MTKELWINLPVKNVNKSKEFFTKLGFSFHPRHNSEEMAGLVIGDKNVNVIKGVRNRKTSGYITRKLNARDALPGEGHQKLHADWRARQADDAYTGINTLRYGYWMTTCSIMGQRALCLELIDSQEQLRITYRIEWHHIRMKLFRN